MKKYRFMAIETAEVVTNIFSVIKVTIENLVLYGFFTHWEYNPEGY